LNSKSTGNEACIYCNSLGRLTDEHAIPFGLGGRIVLKKASCVTCQVETGRLEQRLLRGLWRPYRHYLGLSSRSRDFPSRYPVKVKFASGLVVDGEVPAEQYPGTLFYDFDPPAVFRDSINDSIPAAPRVYWKQIRPLVEWVWIDGERRSVRHPDQIEFPTQFSVSDFCRVLAKIGHCLAIHRRGIEACSEYYLPKFITGSADGLLTYVGGCSTELIKPRLPGTAVHGFLDRKVGEHLVVNLQLFREFGDLPPVYEVVVGTLRT
jgi:hypothetical protein